MRSRHAFRRFQFIHKIQTFQQQRGCQYLRICVSSAVKGARVTRPPSYHRAKSRTTPSSSDGGGGSGDGDERARETTTRTRPQATRDLFAPPSDVFLSRKTLEVILFRQRCRPPCGYARDNCLDAQDKKCTTAATSAVTWQHWSTAMHR